MDKFQLWLSHVVSPVRYSQLFNALLVLDTTHPKAMQDLVETVTSKLNSLDTDQLLFNLQQGLMDGLAYSLQQFEVILKQELTFDDIVAVSEFLETLSRLEHYEDSQEILGYLDSGETLEDQLLGVCGVFYKVKPEILELLEYWNPLLLGRIRSIHQGKLTLQLALQDDEQSTKVSIPPELRDNPEYELARDYVQDGGKLGQPLGMYVTQFGEHLHSDSTVVEQALVWKQLGILAGLSPQTLVDAAKPYFDSLYPNINYLTGVWRELHKYSKGSV